MQIPDLINQMGGLQSVARELGVSPQQAESGAAALLPAILGGFRKQAQSSGGGLGDLLGQLGGGGLLDKALSSQGASANVGNDVLGQIFGSKDVSRTVAAAAAQQSGLDPSLLKKMLPLLATMAAGYLAKQGGGAKAGGGLGGLVGGLLGGGKSQGGGLAALLDANGNGNPLDDLLGMAGKLRK